MHVKSRPYAWPWNGDLRPQNTALIVIDMQADFCGVGGYVDKIILGSVLVLVLAFFPQGLMGLVRPLARLAPGAARRAGAAQPPATTLMEKIK